MKTMLEVFGQVAGEREYQDSLPHHSKEIDENTSVAAWIIYMENHIEKAKEQVYLLSPDKALAEVRKATALGVACMQYNDTPDR